MAVADIQVVEQRKVPLPADDDSGVAYETFLAQQGLSDVSTMSASPLLAAGWAHVIARCCDAWRSMGAIDSDHPVVIVDLVGDDGHFSHLMWQALERIWNASSARDYRLRYVACVSPGTDVDAWRGDAGLSVTQNLTVVTLDPIDGEAWRVQAGLDTTNPVVVLAHDYLHRLSCSLRGVHYGQWMEGRVRVCPEDETQAVEYRWTILDKDRSLSQTLRRRYLRVIQSACVQVPSAALRLLGSVATLSRNRFLWLAADHGVVDESRIRLGALAPSHQGSEGGQPQPVNFHALSWEPSVHGAWVHHHQLNERGVVTQAIWRHGDRHLCDSTTRVLRDVLNAAHPELAQTCAQLAHALPADTEPSPYLALLHTSAYDMAVLEAVLGRWCESPPSLGVLERGNWREALQRAWVHCPRTSSQGVLRHALGLLATHWGFFDLARRIFEADANNACVAYCNACSGYATLARQQLDELDPDDAGAIALREELDTRLNRWRTLAWYRPDLARDGDLSIEPLGYEHAESFLRQYHDPQIAMLTRLPELGSVEEVCDWMAEQSGDPRRSTFAVMSASHGFVGVVSLHAGRNGGYFYFWIGNEHQGHGYGQRVARLVFRQAQAQGVESLFTSVYADNARSIDALSAVGFWRLHVHAQPPDEDLVFFARIPEEQRGKSIPAFSSRLAALLTELDSSIALMGCSS
ncbi:GNAT family N-acetyltransferase [Dyella monticola]|nr:GNAT family N-acetyltransferase [Dyella monticola]